ncbi:MAG: VOC family protein [Desulfobulbaceae bacterium]|uniref:Catechol 2,3-dioxygenase n=2 Tax=Desulfofustis glycolicus TaxID=51195 RepID=A0A1M5Y324_9BACT|nr:VOC family protein [Desulfofustis glycolicus]MCB2214856.1 VOC family protein [Desulfobulbaceae bacterium]SHI06366.1 Catechol 2,3-dioxygenase [Desulfofustis glycolicus DSM 9705]
MMKISGVDHLVLTVKDIERSVSFYTGVLGMEKQVSATGRIALHFGNQKINLHQAGSEFLPCAELPTPGSADICLIVEQPIAAVCRELANRQTELIEGPVARTGAAGQLTSVYIRDPDGNLLELACYDVEHGAGDRVKGGP